MSVDNTKLTIEQMTARPATPWQRYNNMNGWIYLNPNLANHIMILISVKIA
jgi:hypothetical protein